MDWRAACAAVIPCLNEEVAIGPLVEGVRRQLASVFVIDDGSSDGTARKAHDAGAVVLKHSASLGKGCALMTGWTHARAQGYRWVMTLDGDGQHSPDDIPSFLHCAAARQASLVVGNRMDQAALIPPLRRWVNRWMSRQLSQISGRRLPDSQCGFRLINLDDLARVSIQTTHFEIESEVLFLFARAGLTIEFVPIRVIYKAEQSKIQLWRDTVRWLRWRRQARQTVNRG
jgi:glycosyltransferase involved in cell wall biosynthesis